MWFQKFIISESSILEKLKNLQKEYISLNHSWYLAPKVFPPILKARILLTISIEKPKPIVITTDSEPEDLITKESWTIFKMLEIEDKIPTWKEAMDQGKLEMCLHTFSFVNL